MRGQMVQHPARRFRGICRFGTAIYRINGELPLRGPYDRIKMQLKQIYAPESPWETVAISIVLIVTGTILLGGDYVGLLSLDNVRNLWPLALIAIGVMDLHSGRESQG